MGRGGKRKNSGRKSKWASGCPFSKTTTIRVPKAIAPRLLEIARKLDRETVTENETKSSAVVAKSKYDRDTKSNDYCGEGEGERVSDSDTKPEQKSVGIDWKACLREWGMTPDELKAIANSLGLPQTKLDRQQSAKLFNAAAQAAIAKKGKIGGES